MNTDPIIKKMTEDIVKICDPLQIFLATAKRNSKGEVSRFKLCIVVELSGIFAGSFRRSGKD